MKFFPIFLLMGFFWTGCSKGHSSDTLCSSVELRWSLTQNASARPSAAISAISPCQSRAFTDASGRTWKTDSQGRIELAKLPEEWVTWPSVSSRMLDAFVAFWLFGHGYHYLAARQWVSLLLEIPSSPILQHFCSWWEPLRREGAQWERMMRSLPLAAMRGPRYLTAASPRHGFLLRLPADWNIREKPLDENTSLWVITRPKDEQNPLLIVISAASQPSLETILGLVPDISWHAGSDGSRVAAIEGKTWLRRDESAFGHQHVWMAASGMRSELKRFESMESFSMVDPCPPAAESLPETKP